MTPATTTLDLSTLPRFVDPGEGRLMMALKFYELGRLSLGQAAELAGHTKRAFIDLLGYHRSDHAIRLTRYSHTGSLLQ